MKKLLFILLIPISFYAQNDTITISKPKLSVIGLDKVNVVYRGLSNPISIAVNDAKSYTVSGDGVSLNKEGNYVIKPGAGNETKVFVEIVKTNGKKIIKEYTFQIRDFPHLFYAINNSSCNACEFSKENLKNAYIGIRTSDSNFNYTFETQSFNCKVPGFPTVECKGKHFSKRAYEYILKAKRGDEIIISEIKGIHKGIEINGCIKYSALVIRIF
ncbi:MAG TPA: GldM family protein [Flavobacterium sp.]|nr:GldM family protein [Flavobacterium sp.]